MLDNKLVRFCYRLLVAIEKIVHTLQVFEQLLNCLKHLPIDGYLHVPVQRSDRLHEKANFLRVMNSLEYQSTLLAQHVQRGVMFGTFESSSNSHQPTADLNAVHENILGQTLPAIRQMGISCLAVIVTITVSNRLVTIFAEEIIRNPEYFSHQRDATKLRIEDYGLDQN